MSGSDLSSPDLADFTDDDEMATAIKEACFIPDFKGTEVEDLLNEVEDFNSFNVDMASEIDDLIVITSALEEEAVTEVPLKNKEEVTAGRDQPPVAEASAPPNTKSKMYSNRKEICMGMSAEEVEKLSSDKKITEYNRPKSVYDKEVRRRDKHSTMLSMLRQVVPGITVKTDNTVVFERASSYIIFLQNKVGDKENDKSFLKERMPF